MWSMLCAQFTDESRPATLVRLDLESLTQLSDLRVDLKHISRGSTRTGMGAFVIVDLLHSLQNF